MKVLCIKSALLGALIVICLVLLTGAVNNNTGKYQVCSAGEGHNTIFILNTHTGMVQKINMQEAVKVYGNEYNVSF